MQFQDAFPFKCPHFQNTLLSIDCFLLAAFFWKRDWFEENMGGANQAAAIISAIVIFIATLANLASVGSKIVLEKDWIVVVSNNDEERLANMNAVFRTVDLVRPSSLSSTVSA